MMGNIAHFNLISKPHAPVHASLAQNLITFLVVAFSTAFLNAADVSDDGDGKNQMLYENGFAPRPPAPFPSAYKDYQILPGSVSPNKGYALIYPKRAILYQMPDYSPFLVRLKPFTILRRILLAGSNLALNANCWYAVRWAANSSYVITIEGTKWGPDKVFLVPVERGQSIVDLTAEITKQVQPYYRKAKAPRFNDFFDFIFLDDHEKWRINDRGEVYVDIYCTTDPKGMEPVNWTVEFRGVWEIANARFIKRSIIRKPRVPE